MTMIRMIRILMMLGLAFAAGTSRAGLSDLTQTPNLVNEGIAKSLDQQIGAGVGDWLTPDPRSTSSRAIRFASIRRGRQLFQRKFTLLQGFGPRTHDGIGRHRPKARLGAGLIESCAGCHGRPRGAAGFGGDVFTRPDSRDAPHLFGLGLQEMLARRDHADLRATARQGDRAARGSSGATSPSRCCDKGMRFGA